MTESTIDRNASRPYFILPDPVVPNAEDNGGIGADDVADNAKGVLIRVGPWQGMRTADVIEVFWGAAAPAVTHVIDKETGTILLRVPAEAIKTRPAGFVEVWYQVRSYPGGDVTESPRIDVLVDLTIPGGIDPDPGTPDINDNLEPLRGLPALIGSGQAFTLTAPRWLNIEEGDVLTFSLGSARRKQRPVETADLNRDFTFDVDPATVIEAGDGRLVARYEIRDRVNNWSRWSLAAYTDVEIGDRLPAPEATDADGFGIIRLDDLGGGPTQVRVRYVASAGSSMPAIAPGDLVTLTWAGQNAEGSNLTPVVFEQTVAAPAPAFLRFSVPYAHLEVLAQGQATVSYTVRPGGTGTPQPSFRTVVRIEGEVQRLTPPHVLEARGNTLDPDDAPDGATVQIDTYPFIASGDRVTCTWDGTASGGSVIIDQQYRDIGNIGNPILFVVPAEKVAALAGGSVEVSYTVDTYTPAGADGMATRASVHAVIPSPSLHLDVTGVAQALPPAEVAEADGDRLDPDKVDVRLGAHVNIAWPGMLPGDLVHLVWQGSKVPAPYKESIPYTRNNLVTFLVPKENVTPNDGGSVTLRYVVDFKAGGSGASQARTLEIGAGIIVLPAPSVVQASGNTLDPLDALSGLTVRIPATAPIQPGDSVVVTWAGNGNGGSYTSPAVPGVAGGMTVEVPASVLAFNLGTTVQVSYALTRNGTTTASDIYSLNVRTIDSGKLPSPIITQARNGVLDLETFTTGPEIHLPPWPLAAAGQRVWLRVYGTLANGTPDTYQAWTAIASTDKEVREGIWASLARHRFEALRDNTTIRFELKISFDGSTDEGNAIAFPALVLTLRNLPMVLPAPSVAEARSNTLDPLDALTRITVNIPATASILPGDTVTVTWAGTAGGGSYVSEPKAGTTGGMSFIVPPSVLAFNLGKRVQVTYTVTRNGTNTTSDVYPLTVSDIARDALPPLVITQARDGVLDLNTFTEAPHFTMATWPLIAAGQKVWLRVHGTRDDGSEDIHTVWTASPVSENEARNGLSKELDRSRFEALRDGTDIRFELKVAFDGTTSEELATLFPMLTLQLLNALIPLPAPGVPEAVDGKLDGNQSSATIHIDASATLKTGDVVNATWAIDGGASYPYSKTVTAADAGNAVSFAVPSNVIEASAGKNVILSYTVKRASSGRLDESPSSSLAVSQKAMIEDFESFNETSIPCPGTVRLSIGIFKNTARNTYATMRITRGSQIGNISGMRLVGTANSSPVGTPRIYLEIYIDRDVKTVEFDYSSTELTTGQIYVNNQWLPLGDLTGSGHLRYVADSGKISSLLIYSLVYGARIELDNIKIEN